VKPFALWIAVGSIVGSSAGAPPSAVRDAARSAANLVANPGFEELRDSAATGWLTQNKAKWGVSAHVDREGRHSGSQSLRLSAEPRYVTVASVPVPVKPCHIYYLSFWRRQEVAAGAEVSSYLTVLLNQGRKPLYWDGKSKETASCGWKKYVVQYITPADAEWIQVGLNVDCRQASRSQVWYDDVEVLDGNVAVPARPKPIPGDQCPLQHGAWSFTPELSDEFNAPTIDRAKWEVVDRREWGRAFAMMAQNAAQRDGALQIAITRGALPGKPRVIYHSAMLKTRQLVRYGYMEIRARLSACATRNAFWLYHQDINGHGWSEIDIFEAWGGPPARGGNAIPTTLHVQQLIDPAQWSIPTRRWDAPLRLDQQFHVYGLEWNDAHLVVYFDGAPVIVHENNHFYYPLNITLNAEPDGPRPDLADLPDAFVVDYLRVWHRTDQADRRIWQFGFELPTSDRRDGARAYRVKTEDGGQLVFTQGVQGRILVCYENAVWFKTQKLGRVDKRVPVKDAGGKTVFFALRFEDRAHLGALENAGYQAWGIDIQPAQRLPRGQRESFRLPTLEGKSLLLNVTH
jgi:hypothetical protein